MKVLNIATEFSMHDSRPGIFESDIKALTTTEEVEILASNIFKDVRIAGYVGDVRAAGNTKSKANVEVIFNPPYTILNVNGNKYISKAHNEEFDEEKGLLMCLAKANGITHLNLKRMLKGAKRVGKTSS